MISGRYDNKRVYSSYRKVEPPNPVDEHIEREDECIIIDVEYEVVEDDQNALVFAPDDNVKDSYFIYNRFGKLVRPSITPKDITKV